MTSEDSLTPVRAAVRCAGWLWPKGWYATTRFLCAGLLAFLIFLNCTGKKMERGTSADLPGEAYGWPCVYLTTEYRPLPPRWYGEKRYVSNGTTFWPGSLAANVLAGLATAFLVAHAFNRLMKRDVEKFEQGLDPRPGPDRRFGLAVLLGIYLCVAGVMGIVFWMHAEGERTRGIGMLLAAAGIFGIFIVLMRRLELAVLYEKYERRFRERQ